MKQQRLDHIARQLTDLVDRAERAKGDDPLADMRSATHADTWFFHKPGVGRYQILCGVSALDKITADLTEAWGDVFHADYVRDHVRGLVARAVGDEDAAGIQAGLRSLAAEYAEFNELWWVPIHVGGVDLPQGCIVLRGMSLRLVAAAEARQMLGLRDSAAPAAPSLEGALRHYPHWDRAHLVGFHRAQARVGRARMLEAATVVVDLLQYAAIYLRRSDPPTIYMQSATPVHLDLSLAIEPAQRHLQQYHEGLSQGPRLELDTDAIVDMERMGIQWLADRSADRAHPQNAVVPAVLRAIH